MAGFSLTTNSLAWGDIFGGGAVGRYRGRVPTSLRGKHLVLTYADRKNLLNMMSNNSAM